MSIDYKRLWSKQQAILIDVKLKTSNNTYISLIKYSNGSMSFIPLTHGLFLGSYTNTITFLRRFHNKILLGCCIPIKLVKRFSMVHNVSTKPNNEGGYAHSSGTYCRLLTNLRDYNLAKIKLPSGQKYVISDECFVTLGRNSNLKKKYTVLGGAKYSIYSGKKSKVRGVAMNPVDHPHGGRTKTNSPEVSI